MTPDPLNPWLNHKTIHLHPLPSQDSPATVIAQALMLANCRRRQRWEVGIPSNGFSTPFPSRTSILTLKMYFLDSSLVSFRSSERNTLEHEEEHSLFGEVFQSC